MAELLEIIKRSTNNIYAPIRVTIDKVYDVVANDPDSHHDDKNVINIEGIDIKDIPRKIVRMNPKKSLFEDYYHFLYDPTLVYTDEKTNTKIYLGSAYNSACFYTLAKYNIKYIINVSFEISNYYPDEMTYFRIPIRDDNYESIKNYFKESHIMIKKFMENNDGNILVHCYMGASRSASIIINFISTETQKDITEVLEELTKKRPIVNLTEKLTRDLIDDRA